MAEETEVTVAKPHEFRKAGANNSDINKINALAAEGKDVETIGRMLLIEDEVVKSLMPKKGKGKKAEQDPEFLK